MSGRKAGKTRTARSRKNRSRRDAENAVSMQRYGLTVKQATPRNLALVQRARARQKGHMDKAVEAYDSILAKAKLLAITVEDFEYCAFSTRTQQAKEVFQRGLQACLKTFVGQDVPDTALDDAMHDYQAQMIEAGILIPAAVQLGMVPKARKYKSGRIDVLRRGEPDYDFLVELLQATTKGETDGQAGENKKGEVQEG